MPTVNIGNTSKRINSISHVFSGGSSMSCKLKEPCSMQTPVFIVQGLSKGSFYNYASFEGRYYWVDDIVYLTNNIQEVHAHLDPLATYADAIKNTNAFVVYGDAGHWNEYIDDMRMQPEEESASVAAETILPLGFNAKDTDGTCIVTTSSCADTSYGIKNYAMTYSSMCDMMCDLASVLMGSSSTWVGDVAKDLTNVLCQVGGLGSWRDNILAVRYIPIDISKYSGTSEEIVLGGVKTGHYGKRVPLSSITHQAFNINMPRSSEATTYKFLRNSRWTTIQVQTPGGFSEVDATFLRDQNSCGGNIAIDLITGEWSIVVRANMIGTGLILGGWSGNMGMNISGAVGPANSAYTAFMHKTAELTAKVYSMGGSSILGTAGNAVGNAGLSLGSEGMMNAGIRMMDAGSKFQPVSQAIASGIGGVMSVSGVSGGCASGNLGGGRTGYFLGDSGDNGKIVIKVMQLLPKDIANYTSYCDRYGYPCNQYLQIGSVSGYVQCAGATVSGATGASEASLSTINSYLNSGLYIE